jgi:phosphopantetheinyl transferase
MSLRAECVVRYARLDDCLAGADLRARLFGDEARQLERIADAARRRQWLAGRTLAREMLRETFVLNTNDAVQIVSRGEDGLGTHPLVNVNGRRLDCALSLSHTSRGVLVAVAVGDGNSLGVDLCDEVERFSPGFLRLWFTPGEQNWIQGDQGRAAKIWAVKEAVFKAVSQGAPWNPREIEVVPASAADAQAAELHAGPAAISTPNSFRCVYCGQAVEPLSLALRTVDGHTAAVACRSPGARIRFSVPLDAARDADRHVSESEVVVTPVGYSPRWIST